MGSLPVDSNVHPDKLINLQLGWPSPRLFANSGILEGASEVLTSESETAAALIYGPHIGHPPLRNSVASWLSSVYSRVVGPEGLAITNGASGNLSNVLQKFTDPLYTRNILMVEPTYFLACPIFEDNGFQGKLKGIPESENGIDTDFLQRTLQSSEAEAARIAKANGAPDMPTIKVGKTYPKIYKYIIYLVPTFSNPSGKTLPLQVREAVVRLAREYDALVISDDVYDFLYWSDNPAIRDDEVAVPQRLIDIDRDMEGYSRWGNTLSNGSFSKIIGPGIRVGWADCAPALATELAEVGSSSSGGAPSHLTSTFVDKMLRNGHLQAHIRNVLVPTYRKRYYTLTDSIKKHLAPLGVSIEANKAHDTTAIVAGGFFAYLRLPHDLPEARTVAAVAFKEKNLRVAFGHMFTVTGDDKSIARAEAERGFSKCIRLCWAWHEEAEIQEGIRRLAATLTEIRERIGKGESLGKVSIGIR